MHIPMRRSEEYIGHIGHIAWGVGGGGGLRALREHFGGRPLGEPRVGSSLGRTALSLKPFEALFFDVLLLYWLGARRRGLGPEAGP